MIEAPRNEFKRRLLAGDLQIGLWSMTASPMLAEAASLMGWDWLLFDTEHSAVDVVGIQSMLQAAQGGTTPCLARPAWNDLVLIKKLLDIGVQTLVIPFVQTADEARAAVAATRYPPQGIRGVAGVTRAGRYGLAPDYFRVANDEICLLVQIESATALDNIEEIAAVEGVDGLFIGPSDLSASMGHLGNPGAPEMQAVLKAAAPRIAATGKCPGILAASGEAARRYADWGYRFIGASTDIGVFIGATRALLADARG